MHFLTQQLEYPAHGQQVWSTLQGTWTLLHLHLTWNSAMLHAVSPAPSKDTLLLPSLLSTTTLNAYPCIVPHVGEQQPVVLAQQRHRAERQNRARNFC